MSGTCKLEIKTLKGEKVILEDVAIDSSVESLYAIVSDIETTPNGKWKLIVVVKGSLKTLKLGEKERRLKDFGVLPSEQYRIEVVLDMGACHSSCNP